MRRVTLNHVKGHQDNSTPCKKLPLPARLNVDCNTLTKRNMQETGVTKERPLPLEDTEIAFYLGDILVARPILTNKFNQPFTPTT